MTSEWEAPVDRLSQQLSDLKLTLKSIEDSKNQLRPELERMTIELTSLLGAQNSKVEPLLEFPRILKSILSNKQVGAMVFGPDGEKLLYNERAQELLAQMASSDSKKSTGFFKADGSTEFAYQELPWVQALQGDTRSMQDTDLIIKSVDDRQIALRATVSTLAGTANGEIGGAIAFIADISEHNAVVNQLTSLCGELEQRLANLTLATREMEMLGRKLAQVRSHDSKLFDEAQKRKKPKSPTSKLEVLVADDVAVNQKLLKLQLERMGFNVTLAKDGAEAVKAVEDNHFDLILMDCDMPNVDGYDATTQIRAMGGDKLTVPIIAVTAYDREGDREKCLDSGMNDFITKGSPEGHLKQSISRWLKHGTDSNQNDNPETTARARAVLFDDGESDNHDNRDDDQFVEVDLNVDNNSIDIENLQKTYGPVEAESILKLFLGVSGTFVECLELAVDSKDAEAVSHFAYSIKGPCASLNLNNMAQMATRLAESSVSGKWQQAETIYKDLKLAYTPVEEQIAGILSRLPAAEASN